MYEIWIIYWMLTLDAGNLKAALIIREIINVETLADEMICYESNNETIVFSIRKM